MANSIAHTDSLIQDIPPYILTSDLYAHNVKAPQDPAGGHDVDNLVSGDSFTFVLPDVYHTTRTNQERLATMGDEWYYRVHLIPALINLGNLLSEQNTDVEVWNAFFVDKTLSSISETNTEGIELTEPEATPLVFTPLASKIYSVSVSSIGPPTVEGSYSFDFTEFAVNLTIIGKRVVVWPFIPQVDLIETHEWKTNVIPLRAGEQRIALRTTPRVTYQGNYFLDEQEFSRIKATMTQWGHRVFGLPVWPEAEFIGVVAAGTLILNVDTTESSYEAGGVIILHQENMVYEAVEIDTITDSTLILKLPIINAYTAAFVMPVLFANVDNGISVTRNESGHSSGGAIFTATRTIDIAASTEKPQLRGKDLYLERIVIVSSITEKLYTDCKVLDNNVGIRVFDPVRDFNEHTQMLTFACHTRSDLWQVKQWLYSLKGKQKSFFIPSWNRDLIPTETIIGASTSFLVQNIDYSLYYTEKDILILLKDGTTYIKHLISGAKDVSGDEVVHLDSPIGVDLEPADIDIICFISHVRLDSDRVEIKYNGGEAQISIPIREIPEQ